jgi:predicted HicB family RNase H-like nuclease
MKKRQSEEVFSYRGYRAPYQYVTEAKMWVGGIHRGNMFVEFGGDTEQEAEEEFHSILDAYLKGCAENGETPEPPRVDAHSNFAPPA